MMANETYESPTKKLQAIIKSFVKVFDLYKPHIFVFYQEHIYLKNDYKRLIKQKREQFKQIIMQVVCEGKESGEFRQELPTEITGMAIRSEEHTSELQSRFDLVCRLLLEKKNK